MPKGDIILVIFPFTNLSGTKLRPSVILSETNQDVTVSFITTQMEWQEPIDILLQPTEENGLRKASLIRVSKIATLDKSLIKGVMGKLSTIEVELLNSKLRRNFQLDS